VTKSSYPKSYNPRILQPYNPAYISTTLQPYNATYLQHIPYNHTIV